MKNLNEIKLKDLMTKNIVTSFPKMIMTEVVEIFETNSFHHIPVIDHGVCVGVISKSDYYQLQDKFTKINKRVADISNRRLFESLIALEVMSIDIQSLDENDFADKALDIFLENRVHSIIINKGEECVGILTPFDILKYLNQNSYVQNS